MKGKNMILLSIAVLAIGLFVLPQTLAMFTGQHAWFSASTPSAEYDLCEKCHANEVAEWNQNQASGGAHSGYVAEYGEGCFCHQINTTRLAAYGLADANFNASEFNFTIWGEMDALTDSDNWVWRPTTTPHAAVIIDCVDCHWKQSHQISNTGSAHHAFWNQTKNTTNTDSNTACMACHTHTPLNMTWARSEGIHIVANHADATSTPYGTWNINATINETLDYNTTTYPM